MGDLELVKPNSKIFSLNGNSLSRESAQEFCNAVARMAVAKGIKLEKGTIMVWEECLIEDIKKGVIDLCDFIDGMGRVIRQQLFGRIDYADIFKEATDLCRARRGRILPEFEEGSPMPDEMREALKTLR